MNAIETRVSQRHATHFEISIGGQISEIFLEFVDSVFRGKRIFTSTNGGIKRAREREKKKTLSNRFEIVGEPFVYCLLCKLFLTFGRNFLGEENCPRTMADRAKNKQVFPSGDPHERKCNQRNGR